MTRFQFLPFLCLLFVGTLGSSMIVPFMGYFIVEGLGQEPWTISVYAGSVAVLAIFTNRRFARRIDNGSSAFSLIGIAVCGFLIANISLSLSPSFWTVLTCGVLGFGLSASAVSTMFSLGARVASRSNIVRSRFNAYMRATTSTAWMVGPATSFFVADQFGKMAVFNLAIAIALVWLVLWWRVAPRDAATQRQSKFDVKHDPDAATDKTAIWFAVAFVFCLSTAHSLTFTALPLFYVQEVGLPGYAPGTAFSIKTLVEVFAIFSTPYLIARFGILRSLLATAMLAVVTIQILASVQSFPQMLAGAAMEGLYYGLYASLGISFIQSYAEDRPAYATALYWNTLMVTAILSGPATGVIAQMFNFQTVILVASAAALLSVIILTIGACHSQNKSAVN